MPPFAFFSGVVYGRDKGVTGVRDNMQRLSTIVTLLTLASAVVCGVDDLHLILL